MAVEYISKNNDDGTNFGQTSAEKIGFYGLTPPIVRPVTGTAVATTAAADGDEIYGFTKAQADAIIALANSIKTNLDALGLQG